MNAKLFALVGLFFLTIASSANAPPRQILIADLVDFGVLLSGEDDPLKRAQVCQKMAVRISTAIQSASDAKDVRAVAELSGFMERTLVQGVADNLSLASREVPADSPRVEEVARFVEQVVTATAPAEKAIENVAGIDQGSMEKARDGILQARENVKNAQGKGKGPPPKDKGKHKTK